MIQGTMSNAGKSLLVAGLCRIFTQDGYLVAPFKSQNMALNSFITEEGLEMGRAQVMQAEACGIKPSVLMNPILLKPNSDTGTQVIVNGEVRGNVKAIDYYKYKKELIPDIKKAYSRLDRDYDIIVIEGAGSPAEINLKNDDIVNMGMAKMVDAPVLLVGDIDRGGVFAQIVGTILLLEEEEQNRIKGILINKFRGDRSILEPGLDMLTDRIHIPTLGVVPYMHLDIDDEDSLTERFTKNTTTCLVDIAVIQLPRISNFTDFHPFECMEEVSLRYVKSVSELKNPDMIILPGTKNTMEDLLWLRESGLETAIIKASSNGTTLFGVCGGYQMLGQSLSDPYEIEHGGTIRGIGLLPIDTVFEKNKTRTRVSGCFSTLEGPLKDLSNLSFEGYEIHMGISTLIEGGKILTTLHSDPDLPLEKLDSSNPKCKIDGAYQNNVYGTYVHGLFDDGNVLHTIVKSLAKQKGIDTLELKTFDLQEYKESQYDLLADTLRNSIDLQKIYEIMGL
ncbi:cobyric acid synthase [Anaeromicropila herbilytica]|uniref:Cobyric acid synthase n=2 Tax=Anaeromicropila herbilytica TaxID=2785025 RepID=A0A7R7EQ97_9FIRM|nr:cobyric acid synthase [Anaeromicropila herbilytica]